MVQSAFPIISTPDLGRALEFYRDLLGGKVSYQFPPDGEPGYVSIELGTSGIGLAQDATVTPGGSPQRFSLWIYVEDCDAAVGQLRAGGATITDEPADQPWGERIARTVDADGNTVILGSRPA